MPPSRRHAARRHARPCLLRARPCPPRRDAARLARGGGPATGIDRVERACRTADGTALLPRPGARRPRAPSRRDAVGARRSSAGLSLRSPPRAAAAEATSAASLGRARGARLGPLLAAHLAPGTAYLNVGHGNLSDAVFGAVRAIPAARTAVMIHDVIPLRLPWHPADRRARALPGEDGRRRPPRGCRALPLGGRTRPPVGRARRPRRVPPVVLARPGLDDLRPDPRTLGAPPARPLLRRPRDHRAAKEPRAPPRRLGAPRSSPAAGQGARPLPDRPARLGGPGRPAAARRAQGAPARAPRISGLSTTARARDSSPARARSCSPASPKATACLRSRRWRSA
jgi:hypothetical protein